MKKTYRLYLIALLISLFNFSSAQNRDYIPMLNEGAKWIETMGATTFPPSPFGYHMARQGSISGDTLINNQMYHKVYMAGINISCQDTIYWSTYFCAMRENAEDQKVWIIEGGEMEEILYFDFSIGVGDTVPEDSYYSKDFSPLLVSAMDTITDYAGGERRRWHIEDGSIVVEGIGSLNGILTPFFPVSEYWEDLFCYTIGESQIFPFNSLSDCILPSDTCLTVGIPKPNNIYQSNQALTIYPVPASEYVYLQFETETQKEEFLLQIIDFTGKVVYTELIGSNQNSVETIHVSAWPAGIYFATIQNNGRMQGRCNFVVE